MIHCSHRELAGCTSHLFHILNKHLHHLYVYSVQQLQYHIMIQVIQILYTIRSQRLKTNEIKGIKTCISKILYENCHLILETGIDQFSLKHHTDRLTRYSQAEQW